MPQRTNHFQQLVALVHRALAPRGAIVTESALLETGNDGETREIDVLIESKIAEYRIRIAVEAKDERRRMDSIRFESIVGKYFVDGGVKVNKVVVVTHRGFYRPVKDRAKKLGVDLLTLREAKKFDWSQFQPQSTNFGCIPEFKNIDATSGATVGAEAITKGQVMCSCGRTHGSLAEFAQLLFWQAVVPKKFNLLKSTYSDVVMHGIPKTIHVNVRVDEHGHKPSLVIDSHATALTNVMFDVVLSESAKAGRAPQTISFSLAPHICSVQFVPPITGATATDIIRDARLVCSCCGRDVGSLSEQIKVAFKPLLSPNSELHLFLANSVKTSTNGHARAAVTFQIPDGRFIKVHDEELNIKEIVFQVHAAAGTAAVECKQYELELPSGEIKLVSQMQATVAGKAISILMPNGTESEKICIRFDDSKSDS